MLAAKLDAFRAVAPALDAARAGRIEPAARAAARAVLEAAEAGADGTEGRRFLDETSRPPFLLALGGDDLRRRWANAAIDAIRRTGYRLEDLFADRVAEHADRPLFVTPSATGADSWSYGTVLERARETAAALLLASPRPRVALSAGNSLPVATLDLACLLNDILVSPLSPDLSAEDVAYLVERLGADVLVADTEERLERFLDVASAAPRPITVLSLLPNRLTEAGDVRLVAEETAARPPAEVEAILADRPRLGPDDVATVMFTSGSTGRPKGVAFSPLNLLSKRFARAAALPAVGEDERLFCYLPLFHTFGRWLEMLGTVFWHGTYHFAANPSVETLFAALPEVRPTGLVGVPLRWQQLAEEIVRRADATGGPEREADVYRELTGGELRWGLSAAGWLDPRIFRFFHRHGTELLSGFGMTEATGGITMNPPGDYRDETVGRPLPGVEVSFSAEGEMRIRGPYIARYLAEEGSGLERDDLPEIDGGRWLPTGDVFREIGDGHLAIVDRVKDIYKTSRGQTVAPRRVERLFEGVPGVRRVFLAGDHRPWNVLLVVPDRNDPVLADAPDEASRREYFHRIVAAANQGLAPYERVVALAVLDRDFDAERGELTPKGSFRRKEIARNFADVIDGLYRSPRVEIVVSGYRVEVPRWLYRDLGELEPDLAAEEGILLDRRRNLRLRIAAGREPGFVRIGDLEYAMTGTEIDLGTLCRQPRLWLGNDSLLAMFPGREGWDVGTGPFGGESRRIPDRDENPPAPAPADRAAPTRLHRAHRFVSRAWYGDPHEARAAVEALGRELGGGDRLARVLRARLAALAVHPAETVRAAAYRVLLLDEGAEEDDETFGAFLRSGRSFLTEESVHALAVARFDRRRLEALRRRLLRYRTEIAWPAADVVRDQILGALRLLADVARRATEHYNVVRHELASWVLFEGDEELAQKAEEIMRDLGRAFEEDLEERSRGGGPLEPRQVVFDDAIPAPDRERVLALLRGSTFLSQSLLLAFEANVGPADVPDGGVWVSARPPANGSAGFRLSVRTTDDRHYDLLLARRERADPRTIHRTNLWMLSIGGHTIGDRTLPRFGCARPELGAVSVEHVDEPTAEERIRQLAAMERSERERPPPGTLRKLFVRAMETFFRAWDASGRRVVPGSLSPANVVVPEPDFREGSVVLSLAGFRPCRHAADLLPPLFASFYRRVGALQPEVRDRLETAWIFEAAVEAFGPAEAGEVLRRMGEHARTLPPELAGDLLAFLAAWDPDRHVPLPLQNAVERYRRWREATSGVTPAARREEVEDLHRLYRLGRFGERARYRLYRDTYFAEADATAQAAFDRLIRAMARDPSRPPTALVELSELQSRLADPEDRRTFAALVFPRARGDREMEVVAHGEAGRERVTVRTRILDRRGEAFEVREPLRAEEVGRIYRLFYRARFPLSVTEQDHYLLAADRSERIAAGVIYRLEEPGIVHLDGLVVHSGLRGRGLATALLEDFVARLAARGFGFLKTSYAMRPFCERRGFAVDPERGGLVRPLPTSGG